MPECVARHSTEEIHYQFPASRLELREFFVARRSWLEATHKQSHRRDTVIPAPFRHCAVFLVMNRSGKLQRQLSRAHDARSAMAEGCGGAHQFCLPSFNTRKIRPCSRARGNHSKSPHFVPPRGTMRGKQCKTSPLRSFQELRGALQSR